MAENLAGLHVHLPPFERQDLEASKWLSDWATRLDRPELTTLKFRTDFCVIAESLHQQRYKHAAAAKDAATVIDATRDHACAATNTTPQTQEATHG